MQKVSKHKQHQLHKTQKHAVLVRNLTKTDT